MKVTEHFTSHPASVDETYAEHLRFATRTGFKMALGGLACLCHGLFPFTFTNTGSRAIIALYDRVSAGARAPIAARIRTERARPDMVVATPDAL